MNTEQVFHSIREQFQSLFSSPNPKAKLDNLNRAIQLEAVKKAELQEILTAKSKLQEARSTNHGLRERIKGIDKPATKWKPTRSDNI
jgi:hypothetical protein